VGLIKAIHVLLVMGFFVALVLAWYHGEKGRQRVSGPELLMVAALLVIAGVALSTLSPEEGGGTASESAAAVEEDDRPSIAVLPFEDFSPDPDDAYFAAGMQDEIITKLSKIAALRVISRNSVVQYREVQRSTPEVAAELGVDFVMEGSARVAGSQVRLIAQLIDARRDEHLWSEDYDQELSVESLISVQSDIARRVAQAVGAVLTPEEKDRIEAVPTENLEAYEAYMLGRYHLNRRDQTREAFAESVRYLQTAIELDPNLAMAHATLALANFQLAGWGLRDPRGIWPRVEEWAQSALAIDSTVALAHLLLAPTKWIRDWNWEEAERKIRRALELSPSEAFIRWGYAEILLAQGRIEEARQQGRVATALDPLSSPTLQSQGRLTFFSRRYEEADELVEVLLTRDPENSSAAFVLAFSSLLGGRPEQVARLFPGWASDSVRLNPGSRAVLLGLTGEIDRANGEIREALAGYGDQYFDPRLTWMAYAALGEKDEAFRWMERCIEVQSYHTAFLGVTPFADPLRDDPRYQALLDRIGLGHLKARFDSLAASSGASNH
jgi:serine/threonine-protein kinase